MIASEFIVHSNCDALKYIQAQQKLNSRHAKWVEFLHSFHFTIKHKSGKLNQGADALSQTYLLLFQLDACVLGFEHLKKLYMLNMKTWESCLLNVQNTPKVISLFKKGFFSRVHDCVYQGIAQGSF